jgi:hypothetical protein
MEMVSVAAGRIDITPDRPMPLGGLSVRDRQVRSTGVDERLEANFVLFRQKGMNVLLVSMDCLFAGPDITANLTERSSCLGPGDRVFVLATHAHTAPMLDRGKPLLGEIDSAWYRELVSRLAAGVDEAFETFHPGAQVSAAHRPVQGSVSRRARVHRPVLYGSRIVRSAVLMGPNRTGNRTPTCYSAVVRSADDRVVCALVSWACHPADWPRVDRVSPDYIGRVRASARSILGDCPVLFLQGFAGDMRADIPMRTTLRRLLRRAVRGPVFMAPTVDEWGSWAGRVDRQIAACVENAKQKPAAPISGLAVASAAVPLSDLLPQEENRSCEAHAVTIGGLRLFMMTAEVSAAFADRVERLGAWPVGYLGDVFGYFPTSAQVREGGYEADGFCEPFGIRGRFNGTNDAVFDRLLAAVLPDGGEVARPRNDACWKREET